MTAILCRPPRTGNKQWGQVCNLPANRQVENLPPPVAATQLLADIRDGNADAWESLIQRYGGRMYSVARRLLHSEHDSADAVQEAFLCLVRSLDSFEGQCQIWTWLYRILVNICLGKLRTCSRRHTVSIEDLLPAFDETGAMSHARGSGKTGQPYEELSRQEIQAQVRACIDRLAEPYRTVLILRDMEELDTEQTGKLLGLSLAAVKTRLHRARQALRTMLEPIIFESQPASILPEC